MGKIRVKTLGVDEIEKKQKQQAKKRQEKKKIVKVPGLKGGERIVAVGPSEEELAKMDVSTETKGTEETKASEVKKEYAETKRKKQAKERVRSKNYQISAKLVDRTKKYALNDALTLLDKLQKSKFDETVELHINTIEPGISGTTVLPHGTGKTFRVAIANPSVGSGQADELFKKIEQGIIDFDILLATPEAMPRLARVAKFLGPRGLMPNPKNNTLTKDPEKVAASFKKGQINFKTEAKSPIMHLSVGKISYGAKKLSENIQNILEAVKKEKIRNATLKSTMSPGIKLNL